MIDHADRRPDEEGREELERQRKAFPVEWEAFTTRLASAAREASRRVMSGPHATSTFDREDLASEVLVNVFRNPGVVLRLLKTFRGEPEGLLVYLTVVARNRLRDEGRKTTRHKEFPVGSPLSELVPEGSSMASRFQERSFLLSLSIHISNLPDDEQQILDLKYWQ